MRNWEELADKGEVVKESPRKTEIDYGLQNSDIWIRDATSADTSHQGKFDDLYNAAYTLCEVVMRSEGWRTRSGGHHEAVFTAFNHFTREQFEPLAYFFDDCRSKRHDIHYYWKPMIVSEIEVDEMRENVLKLRSIVLDWLKKNHPDLFPREKGGNSE